MEMSQAAKRTISVYNSTFETLIIETEEFFVVGKDWRDLSIFFMEEGGNRLRVGMLIKFEGITAIPYRIVEITQSDSKELLLHGKNIITDFESIFCNERGVFTLSPKEHLEKILCDIPKWQIDRIDFNEPIEMTYNYHCVAYYLAGLKELLYRKTGKRFEYHYNVLPQKKSLISLHQAGST